MMKTNWWFVYSFCCIREVEDGDIFIILYVYMILQVVVCYCCGIRYIGALKSATYIHKCAVAYLFINWYGHFFCLANWQVYLKSGSTIFNKLYLVEHCMR